MYFTKYEYVQYIVQTLVSVMILENKMRGGPIKSHMLKELHQRSTQQKFRKIMVMAIYNTIPFRVEIRTRQSVCLFLLEETVAYRC